MKTLCYHCGNIQEIPEADKGSETTCPACTHTFNAEPFKGRMPGTEPIARTEIRCRRIPVPLPLIRIATLYGVAVYALLLFASIFSRLVAGIFAVYSVATVIWLMLVLAEITDELSAVRQSLHVPRTESERNPRSPGPAEN